MIMLETYEWIGATGQRYFYTVFNLPVDFEPGEFGNYIFTKKSESNDWVPIYIGQGELDVQISDNNPQMKCIKEKGATHVHVHINTGEWARISEEHDLLESHLNVFIPYGCNKEESNLKKDLEDET
jgi:hypothetical protein